jgi:integrase/recombinase XerD
MSYAIVTSQSTAIQAQADSDQQLIALWLHGKSPHSQKAYIADVSRLQDFTAKPLATITLRELQEFADCLKAAALAPNTQKRVISSVKSLFTFGQKLGYLQFNVAAALRTPKVKNTLAARILSEEEVLTMIALTSKTRDKIILRTLYRSATRISELCNLRWVDVQPNGEGGQLTIFGKGEKTRFVKIGAKVWKGLQELRNGAGPQDPVFVSQKGGALDASQVHRIVKAAATRAGIAGNVSAHWLRHSHATHALNNGADVATVRDTLGHDSIATTSRYLHAKPNTSSGDYLRDF